MAGIPITLTGHQAVITHDGEQLIEYFFSSESFTAGANPYSNA